MKNKIALVISDYYKEITNGLVFIQEMFHTRLINGYIIFYLKNLELC